MNELRAHVIISDLSMPGMDGLELLTRIRSLASEQQSPTPAIAFTGFATRENEAAARRAGYAVFIPKPADPLSVELRAAAGRTRSAAVRRWLERMAAAGSGEVRPVKAKRRKVAC